MGHPKRPGTERAPAGPGRAEAADRFRIGRVLVVSPFRVTVAGLVAAVVAPGIVTALAPLTDLEGKPGVGALYLVAVVIVTSIGGLWAGLLSAALSFLGFMYFFLPPTGSFGIEETSDAILAGVLFCVGALIVAQLVERQRLLRMRAEAALRAREQAETTTVRRANQQLEVAELGRLALSGARIQTLIDRSVKGVAGELLTDAAVVLEALGDGSLVVRASEGLQTNLRGEVVTGTDGSLSGLALASEAPIVVDDVESDPRLQPGSLLLSTGARSALAFKIRGRERPWGVLAALSQSSRHFTREDTSFLRAIANVLASAIERKAADEAVRDREARLRLALASGGLGSWDWEIASGTVRWSDNLEQALGLAPGSFAGTVQAFLDLVHPEDLHAVQDAIEGTLERDAPYDIEFRFVRTDGSLGWISAQGAVIKDEDGKPVRMIGLALDVTARRRREERLSFLAETGEALAASLEAEPTLDKLARLAVPQVADCCIVDVLEGRDVHQIAVVHVEPEKEELVRDLERHFPSDPANEASFAGRIMADGRPRLVERVTAPFLEEVAQSEEHLAGLRHLGFVSALFVPMIARGRTLGLITLLSGKSGRRFGLEDLLLVTDLARQAALAVDNARLFSHQRHVASTLQQSLLPHELPDIPGVELAVCYRPADERVDVGGDFYDAFPLDGGGFGIAVGDVCGKGPEAAAVTGLARHAIRTAALLGRAPAEVLGLLNDAVLGEYDGSTFATVAFGVIEPRSDTGARLRLACGGHLLPLLVPVFGDVRSVGRLGTLVGVFADFELEETVLELQAGDVLLLYTDGLSEGLGDGRLESGEGRLSDLLDRCRGGSADEVAARIEAAVIEAGSAAGRDDVAFLVLRVRP
jgi:PAS domain S-box-containing protein